MTLKFLKDSLESATAERLRFTAAERGTFDVVFDADHQVVGAFSSTKPFNKAQRAGFSTNDAIVNAAGDINALNVELAAHTDVYTEWCESYVVDTLANLAELENVTVEPVSDPISDVEREQLIEPIDVDSLLEAVAQELAARKEATVNLGLTAEQLESYTLQLNDDEAQVKHDEDNFVHLAASAKIPLESAFTYSSGFYYGRILNTIINSVKAGTISVLDADGQEFTIAALRPENTDPAQNSLAYLDSERPDGRDEENAIQLSREGETELEEDRKKDEAKKLVVPELPAFDLGTTPEEQPAKESHDANEAHDDDTTVIAPVLPASAQTVEETVESLADGVERARVFLAQLKAEHADVTTQLKGLTETASKRLEKLITSLKEDRTEIDEQIEQLRDKKADIDVQIADTREKKAVVDERLSHKPELEAHAHELADKIKVLSDALANKGEKE